MPVQSRASDTEASGQWELQFARERELEQGGQGGKSVPHLVC